MLFLGNRDGNFDFPFQINRLSRVSFFVKSVWEVKRVKVLGVNFKINVIAGFE